ncbi:hypothetical protein LCGC14_2881650 [marine sediment metagenome]|uniref:GIY-YIG domain-containing protein n=1 Tax=marine sediment metagenome TaxID=412755 RepID=A0A0F8Y058_9ZZZZ
MNYSEIRMEFEKLGAFILPAKYLDDHDALYLICDSKDEPYVGSSHRLTGNLAQHLGGNVSNYKRKQIIDPNSDVLFIPLVPHPPKIDFEGNRVREGPYPETLREESRMIKYFQPSLNRRSR